MKKSLMTLLAAMLTVTLCGQTPYPIPNGSFEQWSTHPGYSVSVILFNVAVFDEYSTPTGWNHPTYPVNETFTLMNFPVTVNTDLPLIKAQSITGTVPDGNKALKLETFMLSDIINSTVYSLASGSLDTTLTQMVIPSVLSTGAINLTRFINLMPTLLSHADSLWQLFSSLDTIDANCYFSGGLPLNGFLPTRLTGTYSYHSAISGDRGCVLLLGTHYNSATHRREVVGGGYSGALTDATAYTPFTTQYHSTHQFDATLPDIAPDSLIIMIVSSASTNRQQGSYLCIDHLQLWHDTCASVTELTATPAIHESLIVWQSSATDFEIEYGPAGFPQGTGTLLSLSAHTITLTDLEADRTYDVCVRSSCGNGLFGEWSRATFTTEPDTCAAVTLLWVAPLDSALRPLTYAITWQSTFAPTHWEVEYGPSPLAIGDGVRLLLDTTLLTLSETVELNYNTQYTCRMRSLCDSDIVGQWASVEFTTSEQPTEHIDPCEPQRITITPNPANGYCTLSLKNISTALVTIFTPLGHPLQTLTYTGTPLTLQLPSSGLFLLKIASPDGIILKQVLNR